jgi:hypothetical protein
MVVGHPNIVPPATSPGIEVKTHKRSERDANPRGPVLELVSQFEQDLIEHIRFEQLPLVFYTRREK